MDSWSSSSFPSIDIEELQQKHPIVSSLLLFNPPSTTIRKTKESTNLHPDTASDTSYHLGC